MKKEFTRDIGPNMMLQLNKTEDKIGVFSPFVDFVKLNQDDLALCFRGNASEQGTVTIYRHNHCMWDLKIGNEGPEVLINLDHARFIKDWDTRILPQFMDMGFRPIDKEKRNMSYKELVEKRLLVSRHKKKEGYDYSAVKLSALITENMEKTREQIKKSYSLLIEMQNNYFSTDEKVHNEMFDVYEPRSKKTKKQRRPHNYIKEYYFEKNSDAAEVDSNSNMYAKFQQCKEKHVQQELFLLNHKFCDGIFIYDLEFVQPRKTGVNLSKNNQPDMFGVRFDEHGKMVAISMIEVKSTPSALNQSSGLQKHLDGMKEYIKGPLMEDRKREACRILNQYKALGLYDVNHEYNEEDFLDLKQEIIFVFSHGLSKDTKVKKGVSVGDILDGYESYDKISFGRWSEQLVVLKKEYERIEK